MPLPVPILEEQESQFISRFMADATAQKEYPEESQRMNAACSIWKEKDKKKDVVRRNIQVHLDMAKQDKYSITPEGFLVCNAYVTRSGIFDYYDADGKLIREYRPPEEVFHPESMNSLRLVPVTFNHPDVMITVNNVRDFQVGTTGENIDREEDFVRCTIKILNQSVIHYVMTRHNNGQAIELSCGYDCDTVPIVGEYRGEKYDSVQMNIRYNHVSIVDRGRAGRDVRLKLDHKEEGQKMPVKFKKKAIKLDSFTMDEINEDIPEEAGPVVDRLSVKLDEATEVIQSKDAQLKDARKKIDDAQVEIQAKMDQIQDATKKIDAMQAKLDQTTEELKKAKKDVEELSNMESPRIKSMLRAKATLESVADKLKVERKDKDPKELKIEIIKAVSSDFNPEGKSDEYISARYDSVVEFVAQAEKDANNSALGTFIKQAKDAANRVPADPRKEFIKKSQEYSKGNK
ncbi:MAG: DUF2213 domain-containing protein [bacterium]